MIVQYVAAASLGELRGHANPRTAFSTTTSAGQEDHVSMGATASWNLLEAIQRCREVLACEAFVAHRAIQFIEKPSSTCIESLIRCMNNVVLLILKIAIRVKKYERLQENSHRRVGCPSFNQCLKHHCVNHSEKYCFSSWSSPVSCRMRKRATVRSCVSLMFATT